MKASRKDIGCYVSDSWGRYAHARAVQIAMDFGWTPERPNDMDEETWEETLNDHEKLDEWDSDYWLVDEADTWMNDNHAVDGAYWGWNDGAWGLWEQTSCDDCYREHMEDDTWREDEKASLCAACYSSRKEEAA